METGRTHETAMSAKPCTGAIKEVLYHIGDALILM